MQSRRKKYSVVNRDATQRPAFPDGSGMGAGGSSDRLDVASDRLGVSGGRLDVSAGRSDAPRRRMGVSNEGAPEAQSPQAVGGLLDEVEGLLNSESGPSSSMMQLEARLQKR